MVFVGFADFKKDISSQTIILEQMNNTLSKRGPDEDGYYTKEHVMLAHKRLIVIDPKGGKQPMVNTYQENEYSVVYNGQIYNTKELRNELEQNGFKFDSYSDHPSINC